MFEEFVKNRLYLRNVSPLTIKSYRRAFKRFGDGEINKASLNSFVVRMRENRLSPVRLSPVTCNISIRAFNSYLTWLYEEGHLPERLKIQQLKYDKKTVKPYSDAELTKILSWKPRTLAQIRLYTLLATLIDWGCRIDELLSIRRNDVDLDNMILRVNGKGGKQRLVPFSGELRKILYKFLKLSDGEYLYGFRHTKADYRSLLKQWQRLCKKLGIEYRGFHSLRHNFGLNFIRQGGDMSELRRLLGHSSITTTAMYVNLQTEDLQRAHRKTSILGRLK